jgi:biotin carboxyl carrier protein
MFEVLLNEKAYLVEVTKMGPEGAMVTVNGTPYEVGIKDITAVQAPQPMAVAPPQQASAPASSAPVAPKAETAAETAGGLTTVKAPLPGLILEVKANVGDKVGVGAVLLVIETMKMENNIMSPVAGTVKEVKISSGQNVAEGVPLIVIGD